MNSRWGARKMAPARRSRQRTVAWQRLSDDQLLSLRFCDLKLAIQGTELQDAIERLYRELSMRGIRFRPHCWLAQEWFSPDGIPGIAIPFYLAHKRLIGIERRFMPEVEGGNRNWLMRILRHEAGHAIDSAYRLRRRTGEFGFSHTAKVSAKSSDWPAYAKLEYIDALASD